MLELADISKRYGPVEALDGVDLKVDAGEIVGLVGPNGAGKTTLLSIAVGLRRPDTGTARVGHLDPSRSSKARSLLGFAPQATGVYPSLTVADNLRLYGRLSGLGRSALETRVEQTAAALDLVDLLDRKAETLSGGERRRVHVAGAVVGHPPLVILDEATAGVDIDARRLLLDFVHRLAHDGTAVLYSTHYLQEVDREDVRLVILDHGRVIAQGAVRSLLQRHGHAAVELSFDGPAPHIVLPFTVARRGDVLRIRTDVPAEALAVSLKALGPEAHRLRGVEISQPNLEAVFTDLTGRRYDADPDGGDGELGAEPEEHVV